LLERADVAGPYVLVGHSTGACTCACSPRSSLSKWRAWCCWIRSPTTRSLYCQTIQASIPSSAAPWGLCRP
jgi:hypothetical protein